MSWALTTNSVEWNNIDLIGHFVSLPGKYNALKQSSNKSDYYRNSNFIHKSSVVKTSEAWEDILRGQNTTFSFEIKKISDELSFIKAVSFSVKTNSYGNYELEFPDLNIFIVEENEDNLKEELCEELMFLWNNYAEEVDDKLTNDAICVKQWLLKNIKDN